MKNYFQPEIETMPYDGIVALQNEKIVKQVKHVYENVPYYAAKMDAAGVKPEDIKSIDDIKKLPFIEKDELREQYPKGFLGCDQKEVVRIQSTSGTTGRRVVAFYTMDDVLIWDECCARAIVAAGGSNEDVVQVCYGYGLFTGGPGLNGGAHMVGAMVLPMSSGNTERQITFAQDLESTILCCTPSYAANIGEVVKKMGVKDTLKLKAGIFGAEPWTEEMRKDIEELLGVKAYDIYGLTEISGPGVSFECEAQAGMHIQEDHFYAEIINPETGEVLPEGEIGELVFTCLDKKAFPLLRYRTRDLCRLTREPCTCGRTHVRMSKIMGRSDDMMVVKGVNVWPTQIEQVIYRQGYQDKYLIVVDREGVKDSIELNVEKTPEMAADPAFDQAKAEAKLVSGLKDMLGIKVEVHVVEPGSIVRSEGKAKRVVDKRNLYTMM